jgi:hypothetical protein
MLKLTRRGRYTTIGGVLSGALLTVMALAVPAGAETGQAANNIIVGSGSSTDYSMMQGLDTLFNSSLGCYMTQPSGTNQTLNFSCASNNQGLQVGEGYTENPVNDVAVEEPALGSSAGIGQLENGGPGSNGQSPANPTAVVNFARSSRQYATTDYPGLNFVGYATDAVTWFTFSAVNGEATASSTFPTQDMTLTDLTNIWNGTYTQWDQIPGPNGTPVSTSTQDICLYTAQESSGTTATWTKALGFASPTALNAYVDTNPSLPDCDVPSGQTYATSHTLPENEPYHMVANGDEADAIYFMSWGKYQVLCAPKKRSSLCSGGLGSNSTTQLGEINGVTADKTTILCDTPACTEQFPVTRFLFNAYSNGTFSPSVNAEYGFPAATPATLNYVSEIGFICKPQKDVNNDEVLDPNTGVRYRTEIADVITENGFLPLNLQTHEDVNTVDRSASSMLKADGDTRYSPNDPTTGSTSHANEKKNNPSGYCLTWTTDGNPAP